MSDLTQGIICLTVLWTILIGVFIYERSRIQLEDYLFTFAFGIPIVAVTVAFATAVIA